MHIHEQLPCVYPRLDSTSHRPEFSAGTRSVGPCLGGSLEQVAARQAARQEHHVCCSLNAQRVNTLNGGTDMLNVGSLLDHQCKQFNRTVNRSKTLPSCGTSAAKTLSPPQCPQLALNCEQYACLHTLYVPAHSELCRQLCRRQMSPRSCTPAPVVHVFRERAIISIIIYKSSTWHHRHISPTHRHVRIYRWET